MKIDLIGMILKNNAGRRCFNGVVLDDAGKPMSAADSLHTLIVEYARVANGGASEVVETSREVTMKPATAGLIAAAPNLLEALLEIAGEFVDGDERKTYRPTVDAMDNIRATARAAIQKAIKQ